MLKYLARLGCACAVVLLCQPTFGTTLYSDNFDVDSTANWTVNDPNVTDIEANFFYDYSAIGVPPAPGGATTTGMKLTANNADGVFGGFSVSPTGESFSGAYKVEFQLWQNYLGPLGAGGSGTTQLSYFGIGTDGTTPVWPGSSPKESVSFAVTLDGGSSSDYRIYSSDYPFSYPDADTSYFASGTGNKNGSHSYYSGFGGDSAPVAQVNLFPNQTGSTDAGEIAFAWRTVSIEVSGGIATWSIDGLPIAALDTSSLTLGGGNILFGHSDTNNSSSSDPNSPLLNVTLIDNVEVTRIPEPVSLALMGLGITGLVFVRRNR